MGSLSLNKKYITNITASSSSELKDAYIFLGGSNNTISTFLNSAELTGNNNFGLADNILIYDINGNGFLTYFLRGDGVTWRRAGSVTAENNTIIPNNSIIALKSVSTKTFTMQGTNLVQKYYQGNISIKKQNLTNLLPYALDNFRNLYIFKGGGANTISTVFNKDDFIKNDFPEDADRLRIFTPDLATALNYYVRLTENRWTRVNPSNPDATNTVILENSPIQILTDNDLSSNLPKSINNGAIVQRYYNGKLNAKKNPPAAPSGIPSSTQTVIVTNSVNFNGTYSRSTSTYWVLVQSNSVVIEFTGASWIFYDFESAVGLNNPSSDANYIPTTGWTQEGSPATITITAA
jgi:hypothetical protein